MTSRLFAVTFDCADAAELGGFWAQAAKNRMHPDLITGDLEAEVQRLIGLGASRKDDIKVGSMRWTTGTAR